jgi:hypothetical protein
MKEAEVYYKKHVLTPESTAHAEAKGYDNPEMKAEENNELYNKLTGRDRNKTQVTIDPERFEEDWAFVSEEEVSSSSTAELEDIWTKYNRYNVNPLSAENNGQHIIEDAGVNHTSMSIGDVIRVEDRYYIAARTGFLRLYLR